ncbi:MAG: RNA polymerase sigma factor [Verrucomicrobiaceae bacterium]|nr:RNA polymerase sigma factor [Verrucomicrobiaceae bacterium]
MPPSSQLERLYDTHAAGVFHYLNGIVRSEADAKDLLQEFFIKLASTTLPAALENERAWLLRIAHRMAIDWLRRHAARARAETGHPQAEFTTQEDPDAEQFARRVERALHELPPEQRSIAEMKLWQGLTFEQIAEAQSIPLNTAASRYRYALEKLRNDLQPLYDEITP